MDDFSSLKQKAIQDEQRKTPKIEILRDCKVENPIKTQLQSQCSTKAKESPSVHLLHFFNGNVLEIIRSEPPGEVEKLRIPNIVLSVGISTNTGLMEVCFIRGHLHFLESGMALGGA